MLDEKQLHLLLEISEALNSEARNGLRLVLVKAAPLIRDVFNADYVAIYPFDLESDEFYDAFNGVIWGRREQSVVSNQPRKRGVMASLITQVDVMTVQDTVDGVRLIGARDISAADRSALLTRILADRFMSKYGIRSFLAAPLKVAQSGEDPSKSLGILYVDFLSKHEFTSEETHVVRMLSYQLAGAVQSAHRLEKERMFARISSTLSRTEELEDAAKEIMEDIAATLEYRNASVQIIRNDLRFQVAATDGQPAAAWVRGVLEKPISKDGLIGPIVAKRIPRVISRTSGSPEWPAEVRSWIGLPLVYVDDVIGFVTLDHDVAGFYPEAPEFIGDLNRIAIGAARKLANAPVFGDLRLKHQLRELMVINEVATTMATKLDVEDVLLAIVDRVVHECRCKHCAFFGPVETVADGNMTVLEAKVSRDLNGTRTARLFRTGEGIVGLAYETGASRCLSDATQHPNFAPRRSTETGPLSMLVVPIKTANNKTLGVICADQDGRNWFSRADLNLVEALARTASIAIERANALDLFEATARRIHALPRDMRSVLEEIVRGAVLLTNMVSGVIYLINDRELTVLDEYRYPSDLYYPQPRLSSGTGITHYVIEHSSILSIPDTEKSELVNPELHGLGVKSIVAVPLMLESRIIGVLHLKDTSPHELTDIEKSVLTTLAGQAATAVESARFLQQEAKWTRQIGSLQGIGVKLTSLIDRPRDLLESILDSTNELTGADFSTLFVYDTHSDRFVDAYRRPMVGKVPDLPSSEGYAAELAHGQLAVFVEHAEEDPRMSRTSLVKTGVRSYAGTPLVFMDRCVGVIFANYLQHHRFDERDKELIRLLGTQVSVAVASSRIFNRMEEAVEIRTRDWQDASNRAMAAERAAAISRIGAEIAHRIRNTAGTMPVWINRAMALLDPGNPKDVEILTYLSAAKDEIQPILEAADGISIAAQQEVGSEPVEVIGAIEEALQRVIFSMPDFEKRIKVIRDIPLGSPEVLVNRSRLVSAIENIFRNAAEAIEGDGTIKITVGTSLIRGKAFHSVTIEDTGLGIVKADLPRVSHLGFSTKPNSQGYGLWLVGTFLDEVGGSLAIESVLTEGTEVTVELPALPAREG
ncbi:MAG TPA: GAF domain-containing protein [Anaerolineae bacterium]|nr:GAF domain-containing protein [Anaerolineae bacterium]